MSTRTAIFQEQNDGKFLGLYIHHDGYIEGVGKMLFEQYSDRSKVKELLDKKVALSSLGSTTQILSSEEHFENFINNKVYKKDYSVGGSKAFEEQEYFIANSLADIKNQQYLTYDNGEVQGFEVGTVDNKEFVAFRGSDNNGFLYYQDLTGKWYVSQLVDSKNDSYKMSDFELLKKFI